MNAWITDGRKESHESSPERLADDPKDASRFAPDRASVDSIDHDPGKQPYQQNRYELRERDHSQHQRGVGQPENQPRLRGTLHPGAGQRGQLADEIQSVVAMAQRAECAYSAVRLIEVFGFFVVVEG